MSDKRRIYISGPMRGLPYFNFPAFDEAATVWRYRGWDVFSPAERDRQMYGDDVADSPTGDIEAAKAKGFNHREALADDMHWIALFADAIFMLRGWERSGGAQAEWALARTLKLEIFYQD